MVDKKYVLVKTHDPDLDRFAELVVAAKGARSMRAFAQACNLNPATFTRITKKLNTGSSRTKLIESIAANADPESGVTLALLADANGYTLQEVHTISERISNQPVFTNSKTSAPYISVHAIITQALTIENPGIKVRRNSWHLSEYPFLKPDLLLDVKSNDNNDELLFVEYLSQHNLTPQQIFGRFCQYILIDSFKVDNLPPIGFLLAISNATAYDNTLEVFGNKRMPINVSLIFVDLENGEITKKHKFPRK